MEKQFSGKGFSGKNFSLWGKGFRGKAFRGKESCTPKGVSFTESFQGESANTVFLSARLFIRVLGIIGSFYRAFLTFISSFYLFRIQEFSFRLFIFSFHLFIFSKYAKKHIVVVSLFSRKKGNLHLRTFSYLFVPPRIPS